MLYSPPLYLEAAPAKYLICCANINTCTMMKPHALQRKTEVCVLTFHILRMWENPPFEISSCYNNVSRRRALFEISLQEIEAKLEDIQHVGRHTQWTLFVRTIIWPVLMYMIS